MPVDTPPSAATFRRPCDYYSSATPEPVLPRWAPFGCGAGSIVVLIVVVAGGLWLSGGGFNTFMDFVLGTTMSEVRGMYTSEVTAAQKKELDAEIATMRKHLREGRLQTTAFSPVLQAIRKTTVDEKLPPDEVREIVSAARKVNATAK